MFVVTRLAQRLKVVPVPEQREVSFVRHDVVDHAGRHDVAERFVHGTKWVFSKEDLAELSPPPVITTTGSRFALGKALHFSRLFKEKEHELWA